MQNDLIILETAVRNDKVMQSFDSEPFVREVDIPEWSLFTFTERKFGHRLEKDLGAGPA